MLEVLLVLLATPLALMFLLIMVYGAQECYFCGGRDNLINKTHFKKRCASCAGEGKNLP
jgi:DnaJ-class molecular chaperone